MQLKQEEQGNCTEKHILPTHVDVTIGCPCVPIYREHGTIKSRIIEEKGIIFNGTCIFSKVPNAVRFIIRYVIYIKLQLLIPEHERPDWFWFVHPPKTNGSNSSLV